MNNSISATLVGGSLMFIGVYPIIDLLWVIDAALIYMTFAALCISLKDFPDNSLPKSKQRRLNFL